MARAKIIAWLVAIIILWWLLGDDDAPRVKKQLDIDANIYSPTFGDPIDSPNATQIKGATSSRSDVQDAIDESTAAIQGYVVPSNPWGIE